ncbi:thioredoxin [Clostridium sp. Cult3]|uniref:thioredoxin n=1 Tax=Clostridium sp. Cult3 TaxID=2079004 RepID=UPI001EFF9107|nr:thioredoxin [Clostridium sp. Cult3]MCF6461052.1 thioredoxin [Clostridium sp. Cult3]
MMKEIYDDNFNQEVLENDLPVLVDFWAPWCGPCKAVGPVLEELSTKYSDKIKFVKLNVDENPEIAGEYRIMSIPTIKIFKKGKVVEDLIGFRSNLEFEKILAKHI